MKNKRKEQRNVHKTRLLSKRSVLFAALFPLSAALASDPVPIAPVITAGSTGSYSEYESNLWFVLDDSGSMGRTYDIHTVRRSGRRLIYTVTGMWITLGYIPYDTNITYELPPKLDGTDMPLPANNVIFSQPFVDEANGNAYETVNDLFDESTSPYTYHGYPGQYVTDSSPVASCAALEPDASRRQNCYIWRNYYRSKMDVLKSTLALNVFGAANAGNTSNSRLGYTSLWSNGRSRGVGAQTLPVMPFYGTDADANKEQLQKWLYKLYASGGTPLRGKASGLLSDIITNSKDSNSGYSETDNPFLKNPGEAYDQTDNPILACRRNYMVLLTDGSWNTTSESAVTNDLNSPSYIKDFGVNNSGTFPDGTTYSHISPYHYEITGNITGVTPLADIAFAAWATDMDNDGGNDDLLANDYTGYNVNTVQQHKGSTYWHPYNDPADWQHINTFTIGFGLNNRNNIYVNPPTPVNPNGIDSWINKKWNHSFYNSASINDAVPDLANAALAGRGRFYDAQTPEDLKNAFDDIFSATGSSTALATVSGSAGTGGASQTLGNNYFVTRYDISTFTGELIKYSLYDGTNSQTCFGTPTTTEVIGTLCTSGYDWNAAEELKSVVPNNREIISLKRQKDTGGTPTDLTNMNTTGLTLTDLEYQLIGDFDYSYNSSTGTATSDISPAQKTRLVAGFPSELPNNTTAETEQSLADLFAYVRGDDSNETANSGAFRSRDDHTYVDGTKDRNILGAIMRSSPVFVGIPSGYVEHFEGGSNGGSTYDNYNKYIADYIAGNSSGDKEVIYVGADDGMLHAFSAKDGEELFAYVPSAVYDTLAKTVEPDGQLSLVDGNIEVHDVYFSDEKWYRALVGAMGGGAKGLYALDVTGPKSGTDPVDADWVRNNAAFHWEYGDLESKLYQIDQGVTSPQSNAGNILASPAIIQLQDDTWVAVVGNGYNSESNKAAVIVINLQTGEPIQELVLDTANTYSDAAKPNGLAPLYFASYPGKDQKDGNKYDRAYAGDLQGNLWVFDLTNAKGDCRTTAANCISVVNNQPLFQAIDGNGDRQPITVYPFTVQHPLGYGYLIHFGTGALFKDDDLSSTVDNSIYAIWDDWLSTSDTNASSIGLPPATVRNTTITDSDLNEIPLKSKIVTVQDDTGTAVDKTVRYIDTSDSNYEVTDWKLGSDGKHRGWKIDLDAGERAWQPAYIAYGADNVEAIAYNTVNYQGTGSTTTCSTPGSTVVSWNLAFNTKDAALQLTSSGVLDINGDNQVSSADATIQDGNGNYSLGYAFQGVEVIGGIVQNSSTQTINDNNTPSSTSERTVCNFTTQLSGSSSGVVTPTTVQRCSYFSSWTELK